MQARKIAAEAVRFFRSAVFEHHTEEERELFPAVLANASPGEERDKVKVIVDRLDRLYLLGFVMHVSVHIVAFSVLEMR